MCHTPTPRRPPQVDSFALSFNATDSDHVYRMTYWGNQSMTVQVHSRFYMATSTSAQGQK